MFRCRPTNQQRCTAAGFMRETAEERIRQIQTVIDSNQGAEAKCLAVAHQDLYRKVLDLAKTEQRKFCR